MQLGWPSLSTRQRARVRPTNTLVALLTLLAVTLTALPSRAGNDMAAAEALFRDARRLMSEGKLAEACRKFAQSQELDPSSGTLLNLAMCHEKQGKTASAWAEYLSAARLAKAQQRDDRAEEARGRAEALADKLSHLTISVEQPLDGLEVRRNGELVPSAELGTKLPMDPGSYEIEAVAPGHAEWTASVVVDPGGDARTVVVPALEKTTEATVPAASAAAPTETEAPPEDTGPPPSEEGGAPVAGYVIGGIGVAALATGTIFGVMALGTYSDAETACPSHVGCSSDAIGLRDDAGTQALIANIGVGVGLVGIGVGTFLILTNGGGDATASDSAMSVDVGPAPGGAAARLRGTF